MYVRSKIKKKIKNTRTVAPAICACLSVMQTLCRGRPSSAWARQRRTRTDALARSRQAAQSAFWCGWMGAKKRSASGRQFVDAGKIDRQGRGGSKKYAARLCWTNDSFPLRTLQHAAQVWLSCRFRCRGFQVCWTCRKTALIAACWRQRFDL